MNVSSTPWATLPRSTLSPVEPFRISIPDAQLEALRTNIRSSLPLFPKTYENSLTDQSLGISAEWTRQATDTWLNKYSWEATQAELNRHAHFKIGVKSSGQRNESATDFDIHFMALFSKRQDAVPIVFLHGWPGSFLEFMRILDIVKEKYNPETCPYHLIVPSLPGFMFSSGPPLDHDWDMKDTAAVIDTLMLNLGFGTRYIAQGGDFGSSIAQTLARTSPSCKAAHVNFLAIMKPDSLPRPDQDTSLTTEDHAVLARSQHYIMKEMGYALLQGTKPATIGFVLATNPVGLLAYLGEKYLRWVDPESPLPMHEILTTVSLYHFTGSIARGMYGYREVFNSLMPAPLPDEGKIEKPLGYSRFVLDCNGCPESWASTVGRLVFFRSQETGGHFAGLERAGVLWGDVEEFVGRVEGK